MLAEFSYHPYNRKNVEKVEERWGVYKLADHAKRVLFLGRGNVKKHLQKHLPDSEAPAEGVKFFSVEYFESGEEAFEEWRNQMRTHHKRFDSYPKYNKPLEED